MPDARQTWDETLFAGAAPFYERGRLPYPEGLVAALAGELASGGTLVDIGAGPGTLSLMLAPAVAKVVAVEPDPEMVAHGREAAVERGITTIEWQVVPAEEMVLAPGSVDVAIFAQSFHWTDRPRVAVALRTALRAGGHLVLVAPVEVPLPSWRAPVDRLVAEFLGETRRAGRRLLPDGTPGDEEQVLAAAGFAGPVRRVVGDTRPVLRDVESVVAEVHSLSSSAPQLFGDRLAEFDARLRTLLGAAAPLQAVLPGVEVRTWTNPGRP